MLQVLSCTPGRVLRLRLSLQGAETRLYYILGFWVQKLNKVLLFHVQVTLE